ncbi:GGDEF domain-containing protein [Thiomicrorhabdus sediminis]|uniref:diguanylate cyclase n=1 Tax=Thiomicrorhabdus sediminis TaxID=2580412 RepID=A0A4P9K638_9GAMM|nr:GGDEF domain-containing protein [Thiomicrorhabdus sediminis]QCU90524.1 GGDEF domain-containing protein [Thiomicrorhabdus sediminis]
MPDSTFYTQATVLVYGLLIAMWLYIVLFYILQYKKRTKTNKALTLLLIILGIDAFRSLFESSYFGVWYLSIAGWLDMDVYTLLMEPQNVIIPKFVNLLSTSLVIFFLHKYLQRERYNYLNAISDPLTKVYNRHYFHEVLFNQRKPISKDKQLSYMLIDIDDFKTINDECGHDAGDKTLIAVAHTIKSQLRSEDLVVRWGGEEFLVALPGMDVLTANKYAENIRLAVEKIKACDSKMPITITSSVIEVQDAIADQELFEKAFKILDKTLYQAKQQGKNTVKIATFGDA